MLALAIALTIAGCAFGMSREKLLSEGESRTAEFALDYETLARCFDRERDIPIFIGLSDERSLEDIQIETDLAVARYEQSASMRTGRFWFVIIEFRGIEPNKTAVKAHAAGSSLLDVNWKTIEGCATAVRPG